MPATTKPVVVALYPLEPALIEYGRTKLDLIPHDDPRAKDWRQIAEGVLVRTVEITKKDVAEIGPKLKFVGKHGVGTNVIAVKELKEKGVLTMNTPGVNVRSASRCTSHSGR
jgi:lactate dehydrogenase-like 2-hydroxyacid dehydrogenase